MPDLIGRKLGKYQLVERLGRGGMAEVYKAYQPGVERHVAIKVMHGHLSDNQELVQRFQREARSIGQLQHQHIGRVIDFDVEADVYYMVMEYIQGGALDSYLKQKKVLPVDEAVDITLQLADALAYAHQRGMIHRDIKPGNILFTDESHSHALLTDFGIARLLDEQQMTMTGALVGTPNYMSPEAAQGEVCDARSDIYSLGVVLYELVTGRTPYAADTPYSFLLKQANEPLPPPRTLNPKLPAALETTILKALAKEPAKRYQSAGDFATALRQRQMGAASAPATSLPMAQPRRPRTPLALAAVGVIAVALITVFALLSLDSGTPPTLSAPTATAAPIAAATATLPPPTAAPSTPVMPTVATAMAAAPVTTTSTVSQTAALTATAGSSASLPITTASVVTTVLSITTTGAPTLTAATTATLPMTTMLAAAPLGALHFVDTSSARAAGFQLALNQMRLPPADHHYELWLVGDGDVALQLGTPTVEQGRIRYQGEHDQSLVAGYSSAELRVVPDSGEGEGEVLLVSSQPPALVTALRELLTGDGNTNAGLLPNASTQFDIAQQHGGFLSDALATGNFDEARRHAEHIVNILDGAAGSHYGDLNGDGQAQNPGDGYGLRVYLADINPTIDTLLANITATADLPFYADRVLAAQRNSLDAITATMASTLKIFATDTVEEAQPFATLVNEQLAALHDGHDLDENGVIDPLHDEGGLAALHEYALRLAGYSFTNPAAATEAALLASPQPVGFLRFSDGAPVTTTTDAGYSDYNSDSYGGTSGNASASSEADAPVPASRFTLELNHLPLPPADQQYVVWLVNAEGEAEALGALPVMNNVILTGTTNENLLLAYNSVLISSEPIGDLPPRPLGPIHFNAEHAAAFIAPLRTALFASEPYHRGLLAGARRQMTLAIAHSGFLEDALDSDLGQARRHAEHIINIIEGETGQHFGDLDGDGMTQNPGDGFGVRLYLITAREAMAQATAAMTATTDSRFFAERYLAANDHALLLLEKAYERTLQIFAVDSADEARPFAAELRDLLNAALIGEDVDNNGVIDPLADEGGIDELYEAGLLLGEFAIYPTRSTAP